jgi:hypothetical protein
MLPSHSKRKQLNRVRRASAFILYGTVIIGTEALRELGLSIPTRQVHTLAPCRTALQTWCTLQTAKQTRTTMLLDMQVGGAVHRILLGPVGGHPYMGRSNSTGRGLYVALCGPLMHLLQAWSRACRQRLCMHTHNWVTSWLGAIHMKQPCVPFHDEIMDTQTACVRATDADL